MATTVTHSRPRNLHISHSWGGGVDRWVRDFCRHDHHCENLVLENVGTENCYGLGLRLVDGRSRQEVDTWYHRDPINETRIHHPGYKEILGAIVSEHEISHIYLSCLIGHTLDVFDLDIPLTKIHHDFYPYCPNIYIYFGGICESCDAERVGACLGANPVNFANHKSSVDYWLDLRGAYTEAEKMFFEALRYDPHMFTAKNNIVLARGAQRNYELPIVSMTQIERAQLLHTMALAAIKQGDVTMGRGLLQEAVDTHPQYFEAAERSLRALDVNAVN